MQIRRITRVLTQLVAFGLYLGIIFRGYPEAAYHVSLRYPADPVFNPQWSGNELRGFVDVGTFDPYHGQLVSAEAEVTCGLSVVGFGMENLSDSPVTLSAKLWSQLSVPGLGIDCNGNSDPIEVNYSAIAFDGKLDFAGPGGPESSGFRVDNLGRHWSVVQPVAPSALTGNSRFAATYTFFRAKNPADAAIAAGPGPSGTSITVKTTLQVDYGKFSGRVYEDRNGNQVYDPGEPLIPNCRVHLFHFEDNPFTYAAPVELISSLFPLDYSQLEIPYATAVSDNSGKYEFLQVPPGHYFAWAFTADDRPEVFGDIGEYYTSSGQVIQQDVSLLGALKPQVWEDVDGDGQIGYARPGQPDEPGIPGVELRLTRPGDLEGPGITIQANALGQLPRLGAQVENTFGTTEGDFLLTVTKAPADGVPTSDSDGVDTPNSVVVWYQPWNGMLYTALGEPPRFGYARMSVDYLTRDPVTGEEEIMGGLLYESVPIPVVNLSIVSATLTGNQKNLRIKIRVEFRDTLNELLGFTDDQRVTQLEYSVNGEAAEVESSDAPVIDSTRVPFWRQYSSRITFTKTIVVSRARAGTYIVRVVSSPNAVGNLGWAQEAVFAEQQVVQTADGPRPRVEFRATRIPKQKSDQGEVIPATDLLLPVVSSAVLEEPTVVAGLLDGPADALSPYAIRVTLPTAMVPRMNNQAAWNLNGEPVHLSPRQTPNPTAIPPKGYQYFYIARGPTGNADPWCLGLVRGREGLEPKMMPTGSLTTGALVLSYQDTEGSHIVDIRPIVTEVEPGGTSASMAAFHPATSVENSEPNVTESTQTTFKRLDSSDPKPLTDTQEIKGANGYSAGDVVRAFLLTYPEAGSRLLKWYLYGPGHVVNENNQRARIALKGVSFVWIGDHLNSEGYGYLNWSRLSGPSEPLTIIISDSMPSPAIAAEALAKALENLGNGLFAGVAWRNEFNLDIDTLHQLYDDIVAPVGQGDEVLAAITALKGYRLQVLKEVTEDFTSLVQMGLTFVVPAPVGVVVTVVFDVSRVVDKSREANTDLTYDAFLPVLINQIPWPLDLMVEQVISGSSEPSGVQRGSMQELSARGHFATAAPRLGALRSALKRVRPNNLKMLSSMRRQLRVEFADADVLAIKPLVKKFREELLVTRNSVKARVAMMGEIRLRLATGELTHEQLARMVESDVIPQLPKKTQHSTLRSMLGLVPNDGMAAHHDLPLQFEKNFLKAGLDPNDPILALPLDRKKHERWHQWPDKQNYFDGGPYNAAWNQKFDEWRRKNLVVTPEDILAFKTELHSGKVVEINQPGGGVIKETFRYP